MSKYLLSRRGPDAPCWFTSDTWGFEGSLTAHALCQAYDHEFSPETRYRLTTLSDKQAEEFASTGEVHGDVEIVMWIRW